MSRAELAAAAVSMRRTDVDRSDALHRARMLNRFTIGWNIGETAIAFAAGFAAGSVSLIGFGGDAAIEVSAALILAWRLRLQHLGRSVVTAERWATQAIALSLFAVTGYVFVRATMDLVNGEHPEASPVGIALAAASTIAMLLLARAKRPLGAALGSTAVVADMTQTRICAYLSSTLFVGLALNALFGWWWADPVAALGIGVLAAREGYETWRADRLADCC